jgi:hypothetical protein
MDLEATEAKILEREWFYEYQLPNGRRTKSYLPKETDSSNPGADDVRLQLVADWENCAASTWHATKAALPYSWL